MTQLATLWAGIRNCLKPHDPEHCDHSEPRPPQGNRDDPHILDLIRSSFARAEQARGVYVNLTSEGYDVFIAYPESMRLGAALKALVPIEVELSKKCKNTPIEFEYVPVTDIPDEVNSSYKALLERNEQESTAE